MSDGQLLEFCAWPNPTYDPFRHAPDGTLSRLVWLPTIGPTSWLLWGTITTQLHLTDVVRWDRDQLAEAHGVRRRTQHGWTLTRTLKRLQLFRLMDHHNGIYRIRTTAPALSRGALSRLPADVQQLHANVFGVRYADHPDEPPA